MYLLLAAIVELSLTRLNPSPSGKEPSQGDSWTDTVRCAASSCARLQVSRPQEDLHIYTLCSIFFNLIIVWNQVDTSLFEIES